MQNIAVKEQLVKTVVKSGNGGAVWVPKNWLGQEVIVILPQKPKLDLKGKIIHLLEPYLKGILAVFIYGSYARHEQTKDSDIDVIVITEDKELRIKAKEPNLEISVVTLERLKEAIRKNPAMYYQAVQEAEPLINAHILEDLKSIKIESKNFKRYIIEAKEHLKSSKELLELDRMHSEFVMSYSIVYSVILRVRTIFIIKCILDKEKFSNKLFKKWLSNKGVKEMEFENFYEVYRLIRDGKNARNVKIKISSTQNLLGILEKELKLIEART